MGLGGLWAAYYCYTLFGMEMRDLYPYPDNTLIVVHHIAVMVNENPTLPHLFLSPDPNKHIMTDL